MTQAEIDIILAALRSMPTKCRYHGEDFGKLGWEWGEPRCDSCKEPYRATRARQVMLDIEKRASV